MCRAVGRTVAGIAVDEISNAVQIHSCPMIWQRNNRSHRNDLRAGGVEASASGGIGMVHDGMCGVLVTGRRRRAVTLLEITLAIALIVPMMATLFMFYSTSLETGDASAARIRDVQLARVVLNRIAMELRQSTGFSAGFGTGVYGTRHEISINTVVIPDKALVERRGNRERRLPGQFDLRQVDYYIAWDKENLDDNGDPRALGLVRRERRTFNKLKPEDAEAKLAESGEGGLMPGEDDGGEPPIDDGGGLGLGEGNENSNSNDLDGLLGGEGDDSPVAEDDMSGRPDQGSASPFDDNLTDDVDEEDVEGAKQELYAPEVRYIEFLYHDGNRWWDTWQIQSGNALPQMIMVTIGAIPELPEDEEIEIIKGFMENREELEPLPPDRFSMIVRIPQADSFFGSRMQREASALKDLTEVE